MESRGHFNNFTYRGARPYPSYNEFRYRVPRAFPTQFPGFSSPYSSFTQLRQRGQNYGSSWRNPSSASTSNQIYTPNAFGHQQQPFASSQLHGHRGRYQHLSNVAENPFRTSEEFEKDHQFYEDYERPQSQNYQDYGDHEPSEAHGSHSFQESRIRKTQFKIKKEKNPRKRLESKLDLLEKRPSKNQRKRAKEQLLNDPNISEDIKKQLLHKSPLEYAAKFLPNISKEEVTVGTHRKKFVYMENHDKFGNAKRINELLDNFIKSEKQKKSSESVISSDTSIQSKEPSSQPISSDTTIQSIQPTELSQSEMLPVLSNKKSRKRLTKEEKQYVINQRRKIKRRKWEKSRFDMKFFKKLGIFPQNNKNPHYKKQNKKNVFGKYTIMAVMKNNFPAEEFTEEEMPAIKKQILDEIANTSDDHLPEFERTVYFCGAILIYCKDNETVDWLKSKFHNKPIMQPECTLKVTLATEMPRSTKIGLKTIDVATTDPKVFLQTIDQLNPEYKATTWRFKKMHKNFLLNKITSLLWLFDVNEDIVDIIKGKHNLVYTGVERATIKIYKGYFGIFDTLKEQ